VKFFTRLVIIILILAGMAYGYIWYKNKQMIDDAFSMIKMQTSASYDSTYVSLDGKSVTTGIEITMPGTAQKITVKEFRFGTGSLLDSFKLVRGIETGQYFGTADTVSAELVQLQFPLTSSMDSSSDFKTEPDIFTQITLAGCDNKDNLEVSDLMDMGYKQVTLDFSTEFSYDKHINQANWNVYLNAGDLGSFNIDFLLDQINPNALVQNPKLKSITMESLNPVFTERLFEHCAKLEGLELEQYYSRHMDYLRHVLYNNNLHFSDEFYSSYQEYIRQPRSIRLDTYPSESINTMDMMGMSPQRLVHALSLRVFLNDKRVSQLFGNPPSRSELPPLDTVVEVEDDNLTLVQGLTLQPTDPSNLGSYIGYDARFSYRGKEYRGRINSVSGSTVRINTTISSGNYLEMPFRINEIKNLQVRREVQSEAVKRAELESKE
jgi:hypothetical protein